MVKKLFKHEILSYTRNLFPIYLILLVISALTRFIFIFESDRTVFEIISVSSIVALVVGCVVCLLMTYVYIITRFYKNLFSNEGYLSFTLPVTPAQHIGVKLLVGVGLIFCSVLVVLSAILISTAGEVTFEIFKSVGYLANLFAEELGNHFIFYVIEIAFMLVFSIFQSILLIYACISIGQLSRKNRVLAAVGVFFIYYIIVQVISTVFLVAMSLLSATDFYAKIIEWISQNYYAYIHIMFCFSIVLSGVLSLVYYFITHHIIKKKLNLE